jgi:predicted DNA-binding protein (MmcQ/YjbR family)
VDDEESMKITAIEKLVMGTALGLPEATKDEPWAGDIVAKVRGKVFVFTGRPAPKRYGFSVKLPDSAIAVLELPNAEPTGYGLGRHGWVSLTFSDGDDVDADLVRSLILESWRAVAPKKLVRELDREA